MTPEEQSKFDQSSAELADTFPAIWYRLYVNMQKEGFEKHEAMELLKAYVYGLTGGSR